MRTHPAIEQARLSAGAYRVRRSQRAWHVWRFYPWSSAHPGWRVIVADVPTCADGWIHVLNRLGLTSEKPAESLPAADPRFSWGDAEWL